MKRFTPILLVAALALLAGCAKKSEESSSSSSTTPPPAAPTTTAPAATDTAASAPSAAAVAAKSQYDEGPRANAGAVNATKAAAGEKLFMTKGCTACHAYGKKLQGPDLKGVTSRRTVAWMEHQIMEPDVMTKTDPISHQLMVENKNLQMLNLHLTKAEADELIEYFKKLDKAGK